MMAFAIMQKGEKMTRDEAVSIIKERIDVTEYVGSSYVDCVDIEALRAAIKALEQPESCKDAVSREAISEWLKQYGQDVLHGKYKFSLMYIWKNLMGLPSAQPTLHGYNIEHLELIARVLQKENLPPERIVEVLTDIGRIVAIVRDEFEETLRRAVQNIERRTDESD